MNRFILTIKILIASIPFFALGYLLHFVFRHIPYWLHLSINIAILTILLCLVYTNRNQYIKEEGSEENIPENLKLSSYFCLILGSIFGFAITVESFSTIIYIDNGRNKSVEVSIKDDKTLKIPAFSHSSTQVPTGPIEIIIDNKTKKFEIPESGNWIYNIDSLNTYIESTIEYSLKKPENKEILIDSNDSQKIEYKLIRKEFYKYDVDYIFDAPESISVKEKDADKALMKTILYKINNHSVESK